MSSAFAHKRKSLCFSHDRISGLVFVDSDIATIQGLSYFLQEVFVVISQRNNELNRPVEVFVFPPSSIFLIPSEI